MIVSVKTTSPFRNVNTVPGQPRFPTGGYTAPHAQHIPQMQLEMLAAGTSGIVVVPRRRVGCECRGNEATDTFVPCSDVVRLLPRIRLGRRGATREDVCASQGTPNCVFDNVTGASAVLMDEIPNHLVLPGSIRPASVHRPDCDERGRGATREENIPLTDEQKEEHDNCTITFNMGTDYILYEGPKKKTVLYHSTT